MSSSDRGAEHSASWLHFAGVGGSGMSALAVYQVMAGGVATGSDRAFDQHRHPELRRTLERAGVIIVPQDGSFARRGPVGMNCREIVVSTAVEDKVPDIARARELGIAIVHRSELLARHVAGHRTIAVSGTSGKSTVAAMVFTVLREAGLGPGLLTGGALASLTGEGHPGNAWGPRAAHDGAAPLLVVEADESDGSLVRYRPWMGVVLNLGLDHKPPAEVLDMFSTFKRNLSGPLVVAAEENLAVLHDGAHLFGLGRHRQPGTWAENVELRPDSVRFVVEGVDFALPHPGRHNVLNAVAAVAACRSAGVSLQAMVAPLAGFAGVARRFQSVGEAAGVEVIDDFAHNPDKIAAALATARRRIAGAESGRILAVFQPHGFGPTRFLREALVSAFREGLAEEDTLWMPEIFFSGGTVTRDISSADLTGALVGAGRDARFVAIRDDLPAAVAAEARPGDLVLVMGARDPGLTGLCHEVLKALDRRTAGPEAEAPERI